MKSGIDASTLGYPLTNALKDVKNSKVLNNLYKDRLWSSFTPQIFKTTKLYESIVKIISSGYDIDDDRSLISFSRIVFLIVIFLMSSRSLLFC